MTNQTTDGVGTPNPAPLPEPVSFFPSGNGNDMPRFCAEQMTAYALEALRLASPQGPVLDGFVTLLVSHCQALKDEGEEPPAHWVDLVKAWVDKASEASREASGIELIERAVAVIAAAPEATKGNGG